MKNSPTDQPRFTCRLVRGGLSIFGDTSGPVPRGPGAAHVAACADCQQFFGACDDLAVALKRDAAREWREAPASLEQNIMRGVKLSSRAAAPVARGTWVSFAAAAACAVAVVLVYQARMPSGSTLPATGTNVASPSIDPGALAAAQEIIAAVPGDLFAQMQPKAQEILQQDPMQQEVDAIASDARKAVAFLARNFLPNPTGQPASGE